MVNSIKCSREVKKTETRYFLRAYGIDEVVMDIQKSRFRGYRMDMVPALRKL